MNIFTITAVLAAMSGALLAGPKVSNDLSDSPGQLVDVIVQYKSDPGAQAEARANARGAQLKHRLSSIKGHALRIPANAISALAQDPDIVYISRDRPLRASAIDYAERAAVCEPETSLTSVPVGG
ncbi:MAG: hypothetical protein FJW39_06970 [Acidobacteria bacterium]|nr:hypothetical protein [Acidobacteriota bacterium]